jgi:hypothetical protein
MKDEGGRMKARLSSFCFHFILHPSAFIPVFGQGKPYPYIPRHGRTHLHTTGSPLTIEKEVLDKVQKQDYSSIR